MKYVGGQSDEKNPFQAQKKKQNEDENHDLLWLQWLMISRQPVGLKKELPWHFVENEEKEAPTPPPERILGPVFASKIGGGFLQWQLPWSTQGASVAPWKIAPMASLSCWAFRANWICRQIWLLD